MKRKISSFLFLPILLLTSVVFFGALIVPLRVVRADGTLGKALSFNGVNNYVDLTGVTDAGTTHTIEFWANSRDNTTASKYPFDVQTGRILVGWGSDTAGKIGVYDGAWKLFGDSPSVNAWHHVVFVLDGSASKMRMYLDGLQYGSELAYTPHAIGGNVSIGCRYSMDSYYFNGSIDEVRIYNRTLTTAEVSRHYNAGTGEYGRPETGLIGLWHFDGDATDYSGLGHNGTVHGATYVDGIVPLPDVAVVDVTPLATTVTVGGTVQINVTAGNVGAGAYENFNVTVYANDTAIGPPQSVTGLLKNSNITLTFVWDTTGWTPGNYVMKASASVVQGETNTGNNVLVDGTVQIVGYPAITVSKSGPTYAHEGDTIAYNITVSNPTNDTMMYRVSVIDSLLGNLTASFNASLAPGASQSATFTYTVPSPSYVISNTVNATYSNALGKSVSATASCTVTVLHPAITVSKSGPTYAHAGDTITYNITVSNPTNDTTMYLVSVTDSLLGNLTGNFSASLAPGVSQSYYPTYTVPSGVSTVSNTVNATYGDALGKSVSATASCTVTVLHPAITVSKSGPTYAHAGDTITYNITVSNPTNDTTMYLVSVIDRLLGNLTGNFSASLAPGVSQSYYPTYTVPSGISAVSNTVNATYGDALGKSVSATASWTVTVLHPAITVSKSGPTYAHAGDTITYNITVSNPSNDTTMYRVSVIDSLLGNLTASFNASLAPGASQSATFTYTVPSGVSTVSNTVNATYADPSGRQFSSTATWSFPVYHPAITVSKSGPTYAHAGDTITYNITVSNPTNDTTMYRVSVIDSLLGNLTGSFNASLAPGASQSATFTYTVPSGVSAVSNTVNATYGDAVGKSVSATATWTVTVLRPAITVSKSGPTYAHAGDTITYNITVSNPTNDTTMYRVSVIDSLLGNLTGNFSASLSPLTSESKTFTYTVPTPSGNITNTVTVTYMDASGANVSASASWTVTYIDRPPTAVFTYSPPFPAANQTVTVNASGSYDPDGYIVSYVWNFGDGNVTTTTNPIITHVYNTAGNYTVTLTDTDNVGLTNTTSTNIIVRNPPSAHFSCTPQYPYVGDTVTFNASSSTADNATIVSYVWNFGDGSSLNATSPTATHVYTQAGNFTVTLTITDDKGATGAISELITVLKAPVAVFTFSPTSPQTFVSVVFNASQSYDPEGYIVSYVWDFGDGNSTTVTNPTITHYYTTAGNYSVILVVSNNRGYADSTTQVITVLPSPPVADFTYVPDFPIVGQTVTFNASKSYDLDGSVVSYSWNFGDGNVTTTTGPIITHVYTSYGNYTVILTVTDSENLTGNKTSNVRVRDYPTANFTVSPSIPVVNSTATFNASMSTPNGGVITSYFWDFGDSSSLNTTNPIATHTYITIGNYTVVLTVSDSEGLNNTASKIVQVAIAPTANFTYSPNAPYVGDTVTFNASSSYSTNGYIVSYVWDFGDGTGLNATGPVTTHIYSVGGNYTVALVVIDNLSMSNATSLSLSVNKSPVAIFAYSPSFPIAGQTATFNASGSYGVRRVIANYSWDFGDGNVTTSANSTITHVYATEGNYTVKLTVTDTSGYNDTSIQTIAVRNYPIAAFVVSPDYPIKNQTTTFDASSSQPRGGTITSYLWNFGDGSVLNTTSPVANHTFTAVGVYNVTLTVANSGGLTGTLVRTIRVRDYPTANFTWSPSQPIATQPTTFNASASQPNSGVITGYTWNFGDGNITTTTNPMVSHYYMNWGNYTVTLTVANSEGLNASITANVRVFDAPPYAYFTMNPSIQAVGRPVTFNASDSYDPDGSIASYGWNFGDGNVTSTTASIITHVYGATGNYTVKLTVIDSQGSNSSISKVVQIYLAPVANFTYTPATPFTQNIVTFNASGSYDPDGLITSYSWDFGDGNTTSLTSPIVYHAYLTGGDYQIKLVVVDNTGLASSTNATIHVKGVPFASFTWTPSSPTAGTNVTFDASSSSPNGGVIVSYLWNFGDGAQLNVTSALAYHVYSAYGNFTVTLTVVNSDQLSNSTSQVIRIRGYPVASFTYSPSPALRNATTTFDATASDPGGGSIVSYYWDFGDGNTTTTTSPVTTHVFKFTATFITRLRVTNDGGLSSSVNKTITVLPAPPVASFTHTPEKPIVGQPATFDASGSYDPDGYIVGYSWNFSDGSALVSGQIVNHTFSSAGTYEVRLTVTDNDGYATSVSQTIEVVAYPSASFTWSPYPYAIISQPTVFNASSSSPGSGTITGYTWNFGDGNTTTTTNAIITHVFNATGSYTVTLTVINSYGMSSSTIKIVYLYDTPYADFTWSPTVPIISQIVTFNASNSRSNGIMIVSYTWDFGDGTPPIQTIIPTTTYQFATAGTYNVTLAVKNNAGLVSTISKRVVVVSQPKVEFEWTPTTPYAYDIVVFNASSSLSNGIITSYVWNFGDSNVTATASPVITHSYPIGSNYTVTLNVTDSYGLFNATSKTISIAPAQAPVAGFTYSPLSPGVHEQVTFNASDSVARGGVIVKYSWNFGDGTILNATTPVVSHSYQTAGNFTVTLNAMNTAGYWGAVTKQTGVSPISGPSASFTWLPIVPCFNQTIKFDASASTPGWNGTGHSPIVNYTWNLGDGNITSTTEQIIYHAYSAKGNYTVTLKVTDADGRVGNLTKTLAVTGLIGDLNGDGKVDMRDVAIVAKAFGTVPGDPLWNPIADLNGDGKVDMRDIAIVARHFGESV